MNIWSPKGMHKQACCKIPYKGFEISIAMDDSCGTLQDYSRSDIRVFNSGSIDVTELFSDTFIVGDAENLKTIFSIIDRLTK